MSPALLTTGAASAFEFDVVGADALAAFYHPSAYAAGRRLGFSCALRESLDLQPQS